MRSLLATIVAGLFVLSPLQVAAQGDPNARRPNTCAPTPYTTYGVTTVTTTITTVYTTSTVITVPTTTTRPHSCYTQVIPTPPPYCPTYSCAGPVPDCITVSTVLQPCRDSCCPYTSTISTPGACRTCPTGCSTSTTYVPQSTGCPVRY